MSTQGYEPPAMGDGGLRQAPRTPGVTGGLVRGLRRIDDAKVRHRLAAEIGTHLDRLSQLAAAPAAQRIMAEVLCPRDLGRLAHHLAEAVRLLGMAQEGGQ